VTFNPQSQTQSTSVGNVSPTMIVACKYCKGKGWVDENELIIVPRKYIKDEYFNDML
jgi:hypothetical protein